MARYRARKSLERLNQHLRLKEDAGQEVHIPERGLGTGNLYEAPVKVRGGEQIDFKEEQRRVEREMRRLGLKRRQSTDAR